jgi:hypothetical protein
MILSVAQLLISSTAKIRIKIDAHVLAFIRSLLLISKVALPDAELMRGISRHSTGGNR